MKRYYRVLAWPQQLEAWYTATRLRAGNSISPRAVAGDECHSCYCPVRNSRMHNRLNVGRSAAGLRPAFSAGSQYGWPVLRAGESVEEAAS